MREDYPGQAFWYAYNPRIRRSEENWYAKNAPHSFDEAVARLGIELGYADESVDAPQFHILPMPPAPAEAWEFIKDAQTAAEAQSAVIIKGTRP